MTPRLASRFKSRFFFKPVQLNLELSDFLVKRVLQLLRIFVLFVFVFEEFRHLVQQVSLPLDDLIGMDTVLAGQFVQGPIAFDRLQGYLGLEIGVVLLSLGHVLPLFLNNFSCE